MSNPQNIFGSVVMILGATVAGQINLIEVFKNVTQPLHLDIHYTMRKDWLKKGLLLTHSITTITIARIS